MKLNTKILSVLFIAFLAMGTVSANDVIGEGNVLGIDTVISETHTYDAVTGVLDIVLTISDDNGLNTLSPMDWNIGTELGTFTFDTETGITTTRELSFIVPVGMIDVPAMVDGIPFMFSIVPDFTTNDIVLMDVTPNSSSNEFTFEVYNNRMIEGASVVGVTPTDIMMNGDVVIAASDIGISIADFDEFGVAVVTVNLNLDGIGVPEGDIDAFTWDVTITVPEEDTGFPTSEV